MQESNAKGAGTSSSGAAGHSAVSVMSAADIIARGQELATKGKVATFDLVFEYNHAVEAWQVSN
jgi:hypothetical protein